MGAGVAIQEPANLDVLERGDGIVGGTGFEGVKPLMSLGIAADGDHGTACGADDCGFKGGARGGAEDDVSGAETVGSAAALGAEGGIQFGSESGFKTGQEIPDRGASRAVEDGSWGHADNGKALAAFYYIIGWIEVKQ